MLDKLRKLVFELEGAILIVLIGIQFVAVPATYALCLAAATRSEERRVGKECRSRWSPYH